jgi:hypothetical protein
MANPLGGDYRYLAVGSASTFWLIVFAISKRHFGQICISDWISNMFLYEFGRIRVRVVLPFQLE